QEPPSVRQSSRDGRRVPTRIKIWFAEREIGLELSCHRVTIAELTEVLAEHHRRSLNNLPDWLPPDIKAHIRVRPTLPSGLAETLGQDSGIPDFVRDAMVSGDPTGSLVRDYSKKQADDEGKVMLIDFRRLHTHRNGRHLLIKDGLVASGATL